MKRYLDRRIMGMGDAALSFETEVLKDIPHNNNQVILDVITKPNDELSKMKRYLREMISSGSYPSIICEKVQQTLNNDILLLKWMKRYHQNTRKAANKILKNLAWRERNKVDGILDKNYMGLLRANFPLHFSSVDNLGRPVVYIPLYLWNLEKIPQLAQTGDFLRFIVSFFEQVSREIKQSSREVQLFSVIINVRGLSTWKLLKPQILTPISLFSRILEKHYPGILHRCIIANCASSLDRQILKFVLLPPFFRRKCRSPSVLFIHLQHQAKFSCLLPSFIPSEELPVECGGWKQLSEDVVDADDTSLVASS